MLILALGASACTGSVDAGVMRDTSMADDDSAGVYAPADVAGDVDTDDAGDVEPAADQDTPTDTPDDDPTPLAPGCAGRDALLCDDFESGIIDNDVWKRSQHNGGVASIEDEVVFEGEHAVRFSIASEPVSVAMLEPRHLLPLVGQSFFARFFINVSQASEQIHSIVLNANYATDNATGRGRYFGLHTGFSKFVTMYYSTDLVNTHEPNQLYTQRKLPIDTWVCIEAHFDNVNGAIDVWFDGVADPSLRVTAETDPPWETASALEYVQIGFGAMQTTTPAIDVYMDAIVFDTKRVGCGN